MVRCERALGLDLCAPLPFGQKIADRPAAGPAEVPKAVPSKLGRARSFIAGMVGAGLYHLAAAVLVCVKLAVAAVALAIASCATVWLAIEEQAFVALGGSASLAKQNRMRDFAPIEIHAADSAPEKTKPVL